MENKKKLYIVSFGDSRKYRLPFTETPSSDGLHRADCNPLTKVEKELNEYLERIYPDGNFAFYTTPRITEVEWDHQDRYADYPLLDAEALTNIKKELSKEVCDQLSNEELDSDAPFSDIPGGVQG